MPLTTVAILLASFYFELVVPPSELTVDAVGQFQQIVGLKPQRDDPGRASVIYFDAPPLRSAERIWR
jgi:hypothetical protein